jgi:hypothetical protein
MRQHDLYTFPYMKVSIIFSVSFKKIHFQDSGISHNVIEANYTYWRVSILSGVCNDMLYFMLGLKFKVPLLLWNYILLESSICILSLKWK